MVDAFNISITFKHINLKFRNISIKKGLRTKNNIIGEKTTDMMRKKFIYSLIWYSVLRERL